MSWEWSDFSHVGLCVGGDTRALRAGPHPTDVEAAASRFLLLARVNPLVLTTMGAAAIAHGATAVYDVSLTTGEREVWPIERHIHGFLEALPLTAPAFTACLHPDQVRSTLRGGPQPRDWRLLPKEQPLPPAYLAGWPA